MTDAPVSHAFVLPDDNFEAWLAAVRPYTQTFERVAVVRSPRGNDLNRYRNVSAVAASSTWMGDNALLHIRRIYPMVVRVDVVLARTPAELTALLQRRIANRDRYGERDTQPLHIFDRFVLAYPVEYTPLAISDPFDDVGVPNAHYGMDIATARSARVIASADGIVTAIGDTLDGVRVGSSVTVSSTLNSLVYRVSYVGMATVSVRLNDRVTVGAALGTCASSTLKIVLQERTSGARGYALPEIADPMKALYVANLRVRPTDTNLLVRTTPSRDGNAIGRINPWDMVETLEMHGRTLAKVGKTDQWLRVKTPDGTVGFAAAWFLEATLRTSNRLTGVNAVGINLDVMHPSGVPLPNRLGGMGWVRMGYNVSNRVGSTDIEAAFRRYAPVLERYKQAGYKVILTTSHQTYGEGAGFVWPSMNNELWTRLIERFADMMHRIMRQYNDRNLVDVWQVWNEPDAHADTPASVPMNFNVYQQMLRQTIPAMRAADPDATILTAGFTGTQSGDTYARLALRGLPANAVPDGIAIHPYGRSPRPNDKYGHFGSLDTLLRTYLTILPGKPLWITEWGVLGMPNDNVREIGDYALAFINHVKTNYRDQVAALCWYAWAQGMHDGFGLVDGLQNPRAGLTERYLNA